MKLLHIEGIMWRLCFSGRSGHILNKQASGDTAHHLGNTQERESTDGSDGITHIIQHTLSWSET